MASYNHGINQDIIQDINRSLVLKKLRKTGMCSRVQLAKATKLKQATVTNIMKDFMDWGLVKEVGFLSGKKGRRSIGLVVNDDVYRVIGIRIARRDYSVGLYNLSGQAILNERIDISKWEDRSPRNILSHILKWIEKTISENKDQVILAIGVALPGPYIRKQGKIGLMTETEGWKEFSIEEVINEQTKLPVFTEHDANAGAYAHYWVLSETSDVNTMIYISAGQGIGAGIIYEGKIFHGAVGTAGEIGHMSICYDGEPCACGNRGCLEKYCSSLSFIKAVNDELQPEEPYSLKEIKEMMKEKDPICTNKYIQACRFLGMGVISLVNIMNPDIIIIGDEMILVDREIMEIEVNDVVKNGILPEIGNELTIKVSDYKKDSILEGAAMIAINEIFENPVSFLTESDK